jgi:transposase
MSAHTMVAFAEADQRVFSEERFSHPHPRVQRRMEVLWLVSQRLSYDQVALLAGVSSATVERYVVIYRDQGLDGLRVFRWANSPSALVEHRESLETSFREQPPHTVAEARQRIKDATGLDRGLTQVRAFLKKCWG